MSVKTCYLFVTGGVVSSLGKGISASSIAALLIERGLKVRIKKLDPYLNQDPGTMSPYQHGEVFVTHDGMETDLDLGYYERFTGVHATKNDSVTSGKIYSSVFRKERRGDYLGATIQVVPHIIDEIKEFILRDEGKEDVVICEIGGTVGDIEGLPFIEAIRQLRFDLGNKRTLFLHMTLLPYISGAKELKTKPTQHAVKELLSLGIQPDMLLCRADEAIADDVREKISLFCNVPKDHVFAAENVQSIYEVPLRYFEEKIDERVMNHFGFKDRKEIDLSPWIQLNHTIAFPEKRCRIAIVGKYAKLPDAYKSIYEALLHSGVFHKAQVDIDLVEASLEGEDLMHALYKADGIIVPGGFGERGLDAKLRAIQFAREKNIPFLGICLGMQLSVIEAARTILGWHDASSTEFKESTHPVVNLACQWKTETGIEYRSNADDLGGTMRLGAYPCVLQKNTKAYEAYNTDCIEERHRHRYEINPSYVQVLENSGLIFSGKSPDGALMEIVEYKDHPWFVATQYHPEYTSNPFKPHPLFRDFIKASLEKR
jgi:CTP synthase